MVLRKETDPQGRLNAKGRGTRTRAECRRRGEAVTGAARLTLEGAPLLLSREVVQEQLGFGYSVMGSQGCAKGGCAQPGGVCRARDLSTTLHS